MNDNIKLIKAEIEHMDELRYIGIPFISKYEVLSLIDKYIDKAESEDVDDNKD